MCLPFIYIVIWQTAYHYIQGAYRGTLRSRRAPTRLATSHSGRNRQKAGQNLIFQIIRKHNVAWNPYNIYT